MTHSLILAVPGTQDTRELDLEAIRDGVARGEIALDNWTWSPSQNAWLPLGEVSEYLPAPAPAVPVPAVVSPPAVRVAPLAVTGSTGEAIPARAVMAAAVPAARTASVPVQPREMAATYYSKPIQEHHEFPIFKILFFILGVIIAGLITVNYFLVDQPFRANLQKTSFSTVQAHAHLGAFVQPNALLVHVMPNAQINADNFADFLTALTQSAPRAAIAGRPFNTVGLTSTWLSEYMITAEDWNGFADMSGFTPQEKRQYVLSHLEKSDGSPVYVEARNATKEARQAREDKTWADLVSRFHGTGA